MRSPNVSRTSARNYQLVFVVVFTSLLILNLWSARAKSTGPGEKSMPASTSIDIRGPGPSPTSGAMRSDSPASFTASLVLSVLPQTISRSGYFKVTGSNFGVSHDGNSHLLVNSVAAIVVTWSDTEITGYIPEGSILGSVPVQVATTAGTSNAANVNVTVRQTTGRIRWRVEMAGDYAPNRVAVAPPGVPGAGTIYVATNAGYLYAWAPDGALMWIAPGGDGNTQVSLGADGTIYTGTTDNNGSPGVAAWNPNGTPKWLFADPNGQTVRAGPNVGPDGKIYVIFRPLNAQSLNFAAIRPDGSLAWFVNRNFFKYGQTGGKELLFGRTTQHVYFAFDLDPDPDPSFTNGGFFAYDFDGHLVWQRGGMCCGVPAVAPDEDLRHYGARLNAQTGASVYAFGFSPYGVSANQGTPDVGPTNIHYASNNDRLWAINPNGSQKWRYDPLNTDGSLVSLGSPVLNPSNTAILMGGGGAFGQESLFLSVDPLTGQEQWRQLLPREAGYEPYGNFFISKQAAYSADGNTGYLAADINGDQSWPFTQVKCVLYALNTGAAGPVNQSSISGQVTSLSSAGISNVSLLLVPSSGASSLTSTTDANGNYLFANVVMGDSYTVSPSKPNDTNGISALDASMAARYAANLLSLTSNQVIAADASNNGTVTSFDASLIARTAVGIPNDGIAGSWKFMPGNRVFNHLMAAQTDQNFAAILVGDVTGNWTGLPEESLPDAVTAPTLSRSWARSIVAQTSPLAAGTTIATSLPNQSDSSGGLATIAITIGDTTGKDVFSYELEMVFDPNVLQPQTTPFDAFGTLSTGWIINANTTTVGHLRVNAFNTGAMTGQGTLLFLKFNVVGAANSQTPLTWTGFDFDEGTPAATSTNGFFTVTPPATTQRTISGRIVTETGNSLAGVVLTIVGSQGTTRVLTDAAGGYRFTTAVTGQFYTVAATLANYIFSPANLSFSLIGDKTDAGFTASAPPTQTENAVDGAEYFVRQQYLDFLGREPDQGGLTYWSDRINQCLGDVLCICSRRIDVSAAFFIEQEFQASGSFVYDLYAGTLGRRPTYTEYSVDRRAVVGGANLETDKTLFAKNFVQRAEFVQKYQAQTSTELFVGALLQSALTAGADLGSERGNLIDAYNRGTSLAESRALVVRALADNVTLKQSQYNAAFVLAEYFSYLRRGPDQGGYAFWLNVLNSSTQNNYGGMVCSFITSAEYQLRFSSVVTHNNGECGQ
ncbi:MAG: fervidolysin [Acidobacteria bacterium]|nr:fervidolysin [Acidobacteriota bacterium]